jgi:hypothetical protein
MANQNGIASRKENKSSSRMLEDPEGFSLGVTRICATAPFSMWDVAIIPHISLNKSAG